MQNLNSTLLSQYSNSPVILSLLQSFNESVDPSLNIDDFYKFIWNIQTAEGYGLDVLGRIVGVNRVIKLTDSVTQTGPFFGFNQAGVDGNGFGQAPFYSVSAVTTNYELSDVSFKLLIQVKSLSNITDCFIPTLNGILRQLFPGRGNAYIGDTGNMSMRMIFEFVLTPTELAILKQSGAFSNPTGVQTNIMQVKADSTFGFSSAGLSASGFNNGFFFGGFS